MNEQEKNLIKQVPQSIDRLTEAIQYFSLIVASIGMAIVIAIVLS